MYGTDNRFKYFGESENVGISPWLWEKKMFLKNGLNKYQNEVKQLLPDYSTVGGIFNIYAKWLKLEFLNLLHRFFEILNV